MTIPFSAITGQVLSIGCNVWLACVLVQALNTMPFSFYYIFVNRFRYLTRLFKYKFVHGFGSETPYYPENESYKWLSDNLIFAVYFAMFWTSIWVIYMLLDQFGTGEISTKSHGWFVTGPVKNMSIIFLIAYYSDSIKKLKNANARLRSDLLNKQKQL